MSLDFARDERAAGERVAAAAREAVGARFRLHGREAATGLDCVGVAAVALRAGGYTGPTPEDYVLRTGRWEGAPAGLSACDGTAAGDVLLCRAGPGQLHLAIRTADGIVHADAGLRRVVERRGAPPWPVLAAWRMGG